jgi:hypothetical protein
VFYVLLRSLARARPRVAVARQRSRDGLGGAALGMQPQGPRDDE